MIRARSLFRSALLLAFALTIAQLGALAHGYTHWQKAGPDRTALHSSPCGDCATFGAVLVTGGSPSAGITLALVPSTDAIEDFSSARVRSEPRHHFQAQGPPTLG